MAAVTDVFELTHHRQWLANPAKVSAYFMINL